MQISKTRSNHLLRREQLQYVDHNEIEQSKAVSCYSSNFGVPVNFGKKSTDEK